LASSPSEDNPEKKNMIDDDLSNKMLVLRLRFEENVMDKAKNK